MTEVFPMVATPARAVWMFWGIAVLLLVLAALCTWLAITTGRVRFEVSEQALQIRGDLFGRSIPAHRLETGSARVLDLAAEPEYRPRWRTFGTAVPGYRGGWFRLANGEKALVFLTGQQPVAYIRVRDGYSLMMSVENPAALIQALTRASAS